MSDEGDWGADYANEWDDGDDGQDDDDDGMRDVRNNFHEAEGIYKEQPVEALAMFDTVIMLEENMDNKEFSFNATKYIIILSMQLG